MSIHLITGAGSGIGRGRARRLLERGDELWLLARDAGRAKELAEPLPRAPAPSSGTWPSRPGCPGRSATSRRPTGSTRCCTSPASSTSARSATSPRRSGTQTLAVNLVAPAELTRLLLPQLRLSRGHVVFVNSTAGLSRQRGVERVRGQQARAAGAGRRRCARRSARPACASPPSTPAVPPRPCREGPPAGGQGVRRRHAGSTPSRSPRPCWPRSTCPGTPRSPT